jgi:hypothetical protein
MVRLVLFLLAALAARPAFAAPPPFIEATATPVDPYVQAEVRYTIRLHRESGFQTGYFFDPEVPDAILEVLGEDEPKDVVRDGRPMQMIERRYALYPQRSGRLEIPSPVFSGRETFVKGEPLVLAVRPKPGQASESWWLPARSVTVTEEWRLPPAPFRAGEPFEQVVTVTAEGLTGAQIPPLPLPPGARLTLAESGHGRDAAGTTQGWRKERRLWLPAKAGTLEIPPLDLPWWDLTTDRERHATLAGRRFVVGASVQSPPPPPVPAPLPTAETVESVADRLAVVPGPVAGVLLAAFGIWLADRILSTPDRVLRRRRRAARAALRSACLAGDGAGARRALLEWRVAAAPASPDRLEGDAARIVRELDRHLYGPPSPNSWNGAEAARILLPALRALESKPCSRKSSPDLPPLNPDISPGIRSA